MKLGGIEGWKEKLGGIEKLGREVKAVNAVVLTASWVVMVSVVLRSVREGKIMGKIPKGICEKIESCEERFSQSMPRCRRRSGLVMVVVGVEVGREKGLWEKLWEKSQK